MKLTELIKRKTEIEEHIQNLQSALSETMDDINTIIEKPIIDQRTVTGKETGVITLNFGSVTVKQDIPKRVDWDQSILKEVYQKIKDADDDPDNYINVKYAVPEKKFSAFPAPVQNMFNPARTVKTGKPKLTFEIKEG